MSPLSLFHLLKIIPSFCSRLLTNHSDMRINFLLKTVYCDSFKLLDQSWLSKCHFSICNFLSCFPFFCVSDLALPACLKHRARISRLDSQLTFVSEPGHLEANSEACSCIASSSGAGHTSNIYLHCAHKTRSNGLTQKLECMKMTVFSHRIYTVVVNNKWLELI